MKKITNTTKPPAEDREHDIALIRQLVNDAERFQNNPGKFMQLLAEDVYLVNVVGFRVNGRDEIYRVMSEAVKTSLSDIITRHELLDIQFLRSDVALVKCLKHITPGKEDQPEEETKAVLTFVMTKANGKWLISSAQNTLIKEQAIQNIRSQNIQSAGKHIENFSS